MSPALANIIDPVKSIYKQGNFIFLRTLVSTLLGRRGEWKSLELTEINLLRI